MKQNQNARRGRGRQQNRRQNSGGRTGADGNRAQQSFRGNPKQHLEKYKNMARDAQQSGDPVQAEYYLQHADHFQRLLNERNAQQNAHRDQPQGQQRDNRHQGNARNQQQAEAPAKEVPAKEAPAKEASGKADNVTSEAKNGSQAASQVATSEIAAEPVNEAPKKKRVAKKPAEKPASSRAPSSEPKPDADAAKGSVEAAVEEMVEKPIDKPRRARRASTRKPLKIVVDEAEDGASSTKSDGVAEPQSVSDAE